MTERFMGMMEDKQQIGTVLFTQVEPGNSRRRWRKPAAAGIVGEIETSRSDTENMENSMKKILVILLAACMAGILSACKSPAGEVLSGDDREQVLAFSEAETDNLMAGLNSGDYAVFSRDFDKTLQKAMTEANFHSFRGDRNAKLGKYLSRTVQDVYKTNRDFYTVIYNADYEKAGDVTMRVVFHVKEPHQVSGIWFNE
jgi:hypothetical protein